MSTTLSVHRCRFVDYTPSAITAIAFPPSPLPQVKGKGKGTDTSSLGFGTLAVGRANGNIELHEWSGGEVQTQSPQAWVLQKVLPGPIPSKVDSLVLTQRYSHVDNSNALSRLNHLRLFSAGGGSEILEWNLENGTIIRSVSSQAGSVWSMAANPASTLLALGCEDGSIRILSLADDNLTHHRRFDRVKSRLLSIAWGPPIPRRSTHPAAQVKAGESSSEDEDEGDEWVDTWLAVGCSDSSLRKFDFASGRVLDRMGTDKSRGEKTLVWAIGVLGDGTIVSGDSLGTVKFWDSATCTQSQSFQAHNADVLCITMGPEGRTVYTSGVDQKVSQFSKVKVTTASEDALSRSRWIHTTSRRLHSHDVRALAVWPPYTPIAGKWSTPTPTNIAPLLVSGGLDMSLVVCPCSTSPLSDSSIILNPLAFGASGAFEDSYHYRLPYSTGTSPAVQVAREAKLVLCRRDTGLTLWKINKTAGPGEVGLVDLENLEEERGDDWEQVADLELKVQTNLVASAISSDGHWIAASDLYETKLFRLIRSESDIRPKRVKLSEETLAATAGATSLLFTADSSKLILGASMGKAVIVVLDLAGEGNDSPRILRRFEHHQMQNVIVGTDSGKTNLSISDAVGGNIDTEDKSSDVEVTRSQSRYQIGPSVATTITCMAASLDGQWLATADSQHRIHVFNLDSVQHHCALPSLPYAIAALSFDPAVPSILVIGIVNNTLQVFDVEARQFPSLYQGLLLPSRSDKKRDRLLGILFNPAPATSKGARHALLWGSNWMCKVKLAMSAAPGGSSRKRRRESKRESITVPESVDGVPEIQVADEENNSKVVTRYRPMLLVDFWGPDELVVVERPLIDLLSTLPPAYFKQTYGS